MYFETCVPYGSAGVLVPCELRYVSRAGEPTRCAPASKPDSVTVTPLIVCPIYGFTLKSVKPVVQTHCCSCMKALSCTAGWLKKSEMLEIPSLPVQPPVQSFLLG